MSRRASALVYATLVLVMLFWAGNSIVARALHGQISPFSLAFCRWAIASLLLLPFAWPKLVADRSQILKQWRSVLFLGVIGVGCYNTLLYYGLQFTTASNALLIQASTPLFVLILNYVFFGTRPTSLIIIAVLVSALGVLVVVFHADPAAMLALKFGAGDALVLAAAVAWALYTALLRLRPAIHALSFLAATFVVGAIAVLPAAVREYELHSVTMTSDLLLGIFYVATFPSVLAFLLYNGAVDKIGGGAAGQMLSLQPVFGALLASLILGEPLHGYHLVGIVIIFSGIGLSLGNTHQVPR
ncbi:MAG TPA: DMT family transporter [Rhizorhapis sp.]|nr:DMT family transporter [Rhizorhapis sp.]